MKVSFVLLSVLLFSGLTIPTSAFTQETTTNDQGLTPVDEQISKMSPEQKIGQLLMIGILESKMTPSLQKRIEDIKPGFLILFRKNIVTPLQTANLIYNVQEHSLKNSGIQMIAEFFNE